MPTGPLEELRSAIEAAAAELRNGKPGLAVRPTLERPKKAGFGDYSSNAAMLLAPALGAPPREIAERLAGTLSGALGERVDHVEVAGPGFLNVFLAEGWFVAALEELLAAGEAFGAGAPEPPEKVLVEFVSANPTGPLTAASGRHAAYGDALARILELAGHAVSPRVLLQRLGLPGRPPRRVDPRPREGRGGAGGRLPGRLRRRARARRSRAPPGSVPTCWPTTASTRSWPASARRSRPTACTFDSWFLERSLHDGEPSAVERTIALLEEKGHVYRSEGAVWLRTTAFGEDQDRVLVRSSGETTYFANDIAYHENKLERGYDRMINPLGSDHHGYISRMKAAMAALGIDPARLEIPMLQFVHIVEGGRRASMSKRRGDFVTLDDLIAEIGVDATRFYMLSRSHDSTIDLDLELAREQSNENPVYYVQYAHARIASMLAKAGEERVEQALGAGARPAELHPAERELIKKLLAFPGEVAEAAERRSPHRIAAYALELAQAFTAFYRDCRVVGAEPAALEDFRIALSVAAQRVIARALGLLGVAAPASM